VTWTFRKPQEVIFQNTEVNLFCFVFSVKIIILKSIITMSRRSEFLNHIDHTSSPKLSQTFWLHVPFWKKEPKIKLYNIYKRFDWLFISLKNTGAMSLSGGKCHFICLQWDKQPIKSLINIIQFYLRFLFPKWHMKSKSLAQLWATCVIYMI
jgi:hypothetical protein